MTTGISLAHKFGIRYIVLSRGVYSDVPVVEAMSFVMHYLPKSMPYLTFTIDDFKFQFEPFICI